MSTKKPGTDRQRIARLERDVTKLLVQMGVQRRLIEYLREDVDRAKREADLLSGEYL